uniref:Cullin-9-like n=1 Tax=Phallusia mammillata TaxID=59560 RepID=A0A6F9DAE0_9ASCI|nr:cullin-9-like [Phallusia mammillata]
MNVMKMSDPHGLTVAVGEHETLVAQELLRQRLLPDGNLENLVRWSLTSQSRKVNTSDNESSTSSSDDNKQSKYVFLWMSNQELMECCPHLYFTDTSNTPARQCDEPSDGQSESQEASSDVEDLDDMRHDVIKLVNRARKQMHRVKNISKPFASLSHTIKVLSTYAGLGSLCGVFRETGALDLILELLWTNDVDTRRAAGRMLRALALHDAGSRAYVLLSLTQDESDETTDSQKKHYADFENRVMVMEMFAETASGEEAHAVALDSVQLPQVPGKALFTLMKCYLRVMSLLDTGGKNQHSNKNRSSWMCLDGQDADEGTYQFEVAMAISDLIHELNRIMDWNGISHQSASGNNRSETTKQVSVKHNNSESTVKPNDTSQVERQISKPLFAERLHDSTVDPLLLASLIKSDQPSTTYKHPTSFSTRRQYANYVKSVIKPGYRVRACQSYQDVSEGDEGVYRQHNESTPPVQVFWQRLNKMYWVYWHHLQIVSAGDSTKGAADPPKFVSNPETSTLWPLLSGMRSKPKRIYGFKSDLHVEECESSAQRNPNQCEWWLLLFYISKLPRTSREKMRDLVTEKFPLCKHMSMASPSFDTCLEMMRQLLPETTQQDKVAMAKSPYCKILMTIVQKEQEALLKLKEEEEKPSTSQETSPAKTKPAVEQPVSADIPSTSSAPPPVPVANKSPIVPPHPLLEEEEEEEKEEDNKDEPNYRSMEEYARAVEMGLRITLIQDDATEKKFGKMLLEEENFRVAERTWRMQQDGEKLSTISTKMEKMEKPAKIIVLTVLHSIVSRTDIRVADRRNEVESMFSDILCASESTDASVVTCYMNLVTSCIREQSNDTHELDSLEIALATSGHLKAAFDIISRFPFDKKIAGAAMHIISAIMGARDFSSNPNANTSYTNIIIAIISSIMMTGAAESASERNLIRFFLQAVERIVNKLAADTLDSYPNSEDKSKVLLDACCIICMIIRKDQSKSLLVEKERLLRIVTTGIRAVPNVCQLRRMLMRMKGLVVSMSQRDVLDDVDDDSKEDKYVDLPEDGFTIGHFSANIKHGDLEEEFNECLKTIRQKQHQEARTATSNLIRNTVLPLLRKSSLLSNVYLRCLNQLKEFITELSGMTQELSVLLLDTYWSELVSSLHGVLEQCASSAEVLKSTLHELAGDCISCLLVLSEMDRDFAVELCGLEAKQTITRLVDKHGTVPKANELKELVTSCERHRALHSKLLAVVLGGCISTALRCVEDARRRQRPINVPLFDQLLDNLCRGADVEMKEDKCFDRLEVSTNQRQVSKLTDGNPKTYWESNGSSGAHWINIFMRKGVVVRKLTVLVAQEDSSYMPARIVVLGGTTSSDVTTQLSCVTLSSTDREVVILENARRYWPVVRISIRRCQQGGIDTRIHGVEVVGPKPSFWPILRRQLYIRTNLTYSVQSQTWVAEAVKISQSLPYHQHAILELTDRITKSLQFEQKFANDFLPNSESALVLGQACRTSLSAPILTAILQETDGNSLLYRLLMAYVEAVTQQRTSSDQKAFASKLRRLTRLLVDLDSHDQPVAASDGSKRPQNSSNFSMWTKRVHSKAGKLSNVESSKMSTTESVGSGANGAGTSDRDATTELNEDNFELESHVNDVCKCWSRVVESRFGDHVKMVFAGTNESVSKTESLEACHKLVKEFDFLQECTRQIFGPRVQFSVAFAAGVWNSFMGLGESDAMRVSVSSCHAIHSQITGKDKWKHTAPGVSLDQLLTVLKTVSGSDFCRVFEQVYSTSLQNRLLCPNSHVDFDKEQRIMVELQPCFPDRRPIAMVQDAAYSRNQWRHFLDDCLERYDIANLDGAPATEKMWENYQDLRKGQFQVTVLRPSAWNLKPIRKDAVDSVVSNLDKRLSTFLRQYEMFGRQTSLLRRPSFNNRGQSLHWTTEGVAEIWDTVNRVELRVTTSQMLLLMHFNHADEVTFDEWLPGLGKQEATALQHLVSAGVICFQGDAKYRAAGDIKHDMDCVPDGEDEILSVWNAQEQTEKHTERRNAIIDCAIVRVMKKKQECLGDLLIENVMRYCHDPDSSEFAPEEGASHEPFLPLARAVRARCEHLIHLGYLLRNDFTPQTVMYNPGPVEQKQEENGESSANVQSKDQGVDIKAPSWQVDVPLKDSILTTESVLVEVDTSVSSKLSRAKKLTNGKNKAPKPSGYSAPNLVFTDPSTTTLSSDQVCAKLKETFASLASILAVSFDISEALVIEFDWNVDKLIESYMVSPAKTLSSIGITSTNSPPVTPDDDAACPVCLNTLVFPDSVTPPCGHTCCKNCWKTYLELQLVQDTSANTTCPVNDCKSRAITSLFKSVLDGDKVQLQKHEVALVRSYVQSDRALSWCHNPKGCERILRKNADSNDSGWCSACGWQTCFACTYVEAHYPASCGHMSQWVDDGGYYEGMNEDAQSKHLARLIAKRCPNCQANIEKNDGCLHMKCAKCGYDFCWRCLQSWRPSHRDYYNCSSKVSKLAHSGQKFIEYSKRCQYHNQAKQFAYRVHGRITAARDATLSLPQVQFAIDLCMKLAQCRKVLAYCNVFNYYSTDTERMNAIGLHSSALENKTLELQALMSEVLLSSADIQFALGAIRSDVVVTGRRVMAECDVMLDNILVFSKQDMKVAAAKTSADSGLTDGESQLPEDSEGKQDNERFGFLLNGRPAGMSDEDASSEEHSYSYSSDSSDNVMSMQSTSDEEEEEDDDIQENFFSYDEDADFHADVW